MASKSDRLKKLETELRDLEQWLKLGLVPKKELAKHEQEIEGIRAKIREEEEKIQFLKESGDLEEYAAPRRPAGRTQYTEGPTLPDIDVAEETTTTETASAASDVDTLYGATAGSTVFERSEEETEEEEDPFSDRNRWKRGMLHSEDEEW